MTRRLTWMLAVATLAGPVAWAQDHNVELSGTAGWVFSDGVTGSGDFARIDPKDAFSWGVRIGFLVNENLEVVALQRTADNKFMRLLGANPDPEELIGGFPKTREELFAYRGLILGSVEAGAFSGDQLQMIADFVDRRGGGLLMIGGPRAFGEGGYGGTPVADALPLAIDPRTRASDPGRLPA